MEKTVVDKIFSDNVNEITKNLFKSEKGLYIAYSAAEKNLVAKSLLKSCQENPLSEDFFEKNKDKFRETEENRFELVPGFNPYTGLTPTQVLDMAGIEFTSCLDFSFSILYIKGSAVNANEKFFEKLEKTIQKEVKQSETKKTKKR